jgi:hypothetical protein
MLLNSDSPLYLSLSARRIRNILFLIIIGFALTSLTGQFVRYFLSNFPLEENRWIDLFDVDYERSFPTIYSVLSLQVCSVLLGTIAYMTAKFQRGKQVRYWFVLSLLFLFLSFDEAISLHERLSGPLRRAFSPTGIFHHAWVIPGIVFVLVCLLIFFNFLMSLPPKIRFLFFLSGIIFVSGSIGMELAGGYWVSHYGAQNFISSLLVTIEEFLEMLGIVFFIYALLIHLNSLVKVLHMSFKE